MALVEGTDPDDVDFVALALHLNAGLWTGDKPLYNGLKAAGFDTVFNTVDTTQLRDRLTLIQFYSFGGPSSLAVQLHSYIHALIRVPAGIAHLTRHIAQPRHIA